MKVVILIFWACVMLAVGGVQHRLGEWQWVVDVAVAVGLIAAASYYHNDGRAR